MSSNSSRDLLKIVGVSKTINGRLILGDINLSVGRGTVTALIGPSGSGKSTLLRCINSLEDYQAGEIMLNGERLSYRGENPARRRLSDRELSAERSRIGMVFQSYTLFPHLTAAENIMLGLRRVRKQQKSSAREETQHWLDRVGLADFADRYPHQLSGGQQQRVAIARSLALSPELVLLDEVTSALDPELAYEVLEVIRNLADAGSTMMVVSHEMNFVQDVADEIAFMRDGRIVEIGSPVEIFSAGSKAHSFLSRTSHRDATRANAENEKVMEMQS